MTIPVPAASTAAPHLPGSGLRGWVRDHPAARRGAFALAFALAVALGRATRLPGTQLSLIWPAAGIGALWIAASWRARRDRWVDTALVGVVAAAVNLATGGVPAGAALLGLANAVMALVPAAVYQRWGPGRWVLRRPVDLITLGAGAVAGAVASLPAALLVAALTGRVTWAVAGLYLLRISVSLFVVAAIGLRFADPRPSPRAAAGRRETALAVAVVVAGYAAVFGLGRGVPVAFVVLPLSAWVSLRRPTTAAAAHVFAAATAVLLLTMHGRGPFGTAGPVAQAALAQSFTAVLAFLTLVLALHRDDRVSLEVRLREAQAQSRAQADLLRGVIDTIGDGVVVVDAAGNTIVRNPAAQRLLGLPPLAFHRVDLSDDSCDWSGYYGTFHADGRPFPAADLPITRALRGAVVGDTDMVIRNPSLPRGRTVSVNAQPMTETGPDGGVRVTGATAAFRDVTAARTAAAETAAARDLFAGVLDAATEQSIIGTDDHGRITVFNPGAELMLGRSAAEVLGTSLADLHDPAELAARAGELGLAPDGDPSEPLLARARTARHDTRVWTVRTATGRRLEIRETVTAMRDRAGSVTGFISVAADITRQVAAERRTADSEQLFRLGFETAPVGMAMVGLSGTAAGSFLRVNPAIADFLGRSESELLGGGVDLLGDPAEESSCRAAFTELLGGRRERVREEVRFRHADGRELWGLLSASVIRPTGGGEPYLVCLVEDVTARRRAEHSLRHQALHDALTGLPNRVLLRDRIGLSLAAADRSGRSVGVLYLDLDGFKAVNDGAGHAAGDELLRQVATRLEDSTRPGDTAARLGGDEFAVVCPDVHRPQDLHVVAERVLAALRAPFEVAGATHRVSASVGMSVSSPGTGADELLRAADEAMYAAKRGGKDRVRGAGTALSGARARADRLVPQLGRAMARDELVLHGQPVVDLHSGAVVAVETLVRWRHPQRGMLAPADFLPALEDSSRVAEFGRWVLDESCRQAATWHEAFGAAGPAVHVNVSAHQMRGEDLLEEVSAALDRHGLPGDRLVLELTETAVPTVDGELRRALAQLRGRGVRLAIDDIGTGYGSLARLTELPVDQLKVDTTFVAGLGRDPGCDAVVRAIVGISQSLGLSVVAEGVENPAQADLLLRYGCDTAQGYLFSPPRPADALLALLRSGSGSLVLPRLRPVPAG